MIMRASLLLLFCMVSGSLLAQQPSTSAKLKEAFLAILRKQTAEFMTQSAGQTSQMTPEEKDSVGVTSLEMSKEELTWKIRS